MRIRDTSNLFEASLEKNVLSLMLSYSRETMPNRVTGKKMERGRDHPFV